MVGRDALIAPHCRYLRIIGDTTAKMSNQGRVSPHSRKVRFARGTLKPHATASLRDWPRRKAVWLVLRTAASLPRVRPSARRRVLRTQKRPSADTEVRGSRAVTLHSKKLRLLQARRRKIAQAICLASSVRVLKTPSIPRYLRIINAFPRKMHNQQRVSPHFRDLSARRIGAEGGRKRA